MVNASLDWALTRKVFIKLPLFFLFKTLEKKKYVSSPRKPCDQIPNADTSLCTPGQQTGWEWNVGFTGFNLNADMALFKVSSVAGEYWHHILLQHFDVDDEGKPSCEYADCPLSPSARWLWFLTKTVKHFMNIWYFLDMSKLSVQTTMCGFRSLAGYTIKCWWMAIQSWRKWDNQKEESP